MSNGLLSIAAQQSLSMTSKQVADYLNQFNADAGIETRFRHDNVKRTIETLAKQGAVKFPQIEEIPTATKPVAVFVFEGEQGKRDCITLVAQLSPLHTAWIVDRWIELEQKACKPALPDFNNPVAAARAWADSEEGRLEAEKRLSLAAPKVEFADRVSNGKGTMSRRNAAKCLQHPTMAFNQWLKDNRFSNRDGMPSQSEIKRGHQRVVVGESNGHTHSTPRITAKGLLYYAIKLYSSEVPDDVLESIESFKAGDCA